MANLDIGVPERYVGKETVRIGKGPDGPRNFVQGQGADLVPTESGPGNVDFVDDDFKGEALTLDGVNAEGRLALRNVVQGIVLSGQELTYRAVMEALQIEAARAEESKPRQGDFSGLY